MRTLTFCQCGLLFYSKGTGKPVGYWMTFADSEEDAIGKTGINPTHT